MGKKQVEQIDELVLKARRRRDVERKEEVELLTESSWFQGDVNPNPGRVTKFSELRVLSLNTQGSSNAGRVFQDVGLDLSLHTMNLHAFSMSTRQIETFAAAAQKEGWGHVSSSLADLTGLRTRA